MPTMNIIESNLFRRDVSKIKDKAIRNQVDKTLKLLASDASHPSLNNKRIICKRADNLYSVRVNKNYRILYLLYKEHIELFRLLDHDKYDRMTKDC